MDQATQVELSKQVFAHLDAGTTDMWAAPQSVPVDVYTSAEKLGRERAVLFRKYPQMVGFSCQLPGPGDYLTDDGGGVPILLTRNRDGALNGFLNVCRHRGARLAAGRGQAASRRFVCPYHAWTYNLDGKLIGVPHGDAFPGLDKSCNGLVRLPVEEKYGMIWVTPSANGAAVSDLDSHLAGLGPELGHYRFDDYHHYENRELIQDFNWKIVIDTFLEPYHFGFLHKNTVGPIFIPNLCLFEPFGLNLRETLPRRSITRMRELPERDWDLIFHSALVYVLFPNVVLIMQADHAEVWRVYPVRDRVDQCRISLDFYIPEPAETASSRRHWDRNMDLTVRTVAEEDFPTSEGIQSGFASGAQDHIRFGRNEPALIHYEASIEKALAEDANLSL